jgi:hypothetical protein
MLGKIANKTSTLEYVSITRAYFLDFNSETHLALSPDASGVISEQFLNFIKATLYLRANQAKSFICELAKVAN